MREYLDQALRAELQEDLDLVQHSRAETELTTYRGFLIGFFLFGLGIVLAAVVVYRGRQNEERRRRYETLLEASLNPIEVVDINGEILHVNPAFERWVGRKLDDLLGRSIFEGMRISSLTEEREALWQHVSGLLRSGHALSGELELPGSMGRSAIHC